ncbi:MAG: hypothetical protein LBG27_07085 [Spirochaetaceae bacterium]|jgi:hypothetical protein|nr:hypothetical protein [Spirochaetaceae bacterium]
MASDYVPSRDAAFDMWFNNLVEYVLARVLAGTPARPHIPAAEAEALAASCTAWHTAYVPTQKPHTSVDTEAKNDAKKAALKVIRPFVNRYLRYSPVTDEDRTAMAIPNHDTHPTPVPRPDDIPEVETLTPKPRILRFRFRRANRKRWGKPDGVHGMELVWVIAEAPPVRVADLVHSAFATKSPLTLAFEEDERGKRVYYAARWETDAMKKGDYSEIYAAVIP